MQTLKQFGKQLPIGYGDESGVVHKEFELRPWTWDIEEAIGEKIEKTKRLTFGGYVSAVLSETVKSVGAVDFDNLQGPKRQMVLSQMYYADVLCMYVWARIEGMGHELKLAPFECTECNGQVPDFVGDLRQVEVADAEKKSLNVKLSGKIEYAGKESDEVVVEPLRWSFFEAEQFAQALQNPAKYKRLTIQSGVVEVVGAPKPACITQAHLKSMLPKDILKLVREIDGCGGGIVMEIDYECPHCGAESQEAINWAYHDFFGRSVP